MGDKTIKKYEDIWKHLKKGHTPYLYEWEIRELREYMENHNEKELDEFVSRFHYEQNTVNDILFGCRLKQAIKNTQ